MAISKNLLEILACPKCKGDVQLSEKEEGLSCFECNLFYPIRDEIPVMLLDKATAIDA